MVPDLGPIAEQLERDGFIVLPDVYKELVPQLRFAFDQGWGAVKEEMEETDAKWKTRRYKFKGPLFFLGGQQYEGKRVLELEAGQLVDFGHGRYDWGIFSAPESVPAFKPYEEAILTAEPIKSLVQSRLKFGYLGYIGCLPVDKNEPIQSHGEWHRDALSLFEDETIDLALPPMYMTLVLPLVDVHEGDGGTEFVPGSHKMNMREIGITDIGALNEWTKTQNTHVVNADAGAAILFDGWTIHRGTKTTRCEGECRRAIYVVFRKNWYSDDDENDYTEKEE